MRLRLTVKRHELPAVKLLFGVPAGEPSISQLMELVNDTVPLESDQWAIEDYVMLFQGYECLHYQEARAILEDGDEVEIRPLSAPEQKLRRASGRLQFSTSGVRLVDGVAFGRPFANHTQRPSIHIPPLKKRRTTTWGPGTEVVPRSIPNLAQQNLAMDGSEHARPRRASSAQSTPVPNRDPPNEHANFGVKSCSKINTGVDQKRAEMQAISFSARASESPSVESSALSSSSDSETFESTSSEDIGDTSDNGDTELSPCSEAPTSAPHSASSNEGPESYKTHTHDINRIEPHSRQLNKPGAAGTNSRGRGKRATQSRNRRRRDAKRRRFLEEGPNNLMAKSAPAVDGTSPEVAPELQSKRDLLLSAVSMIRSVPTLGMSSSSHAEMIPESLSTTAPNNDDYELTEGNDQFASTSWRDKIALSAVECNDWDVELSAPPFPFQQRWDPQYQYPRKRGKKRKHHEAGLETNDLPQLPILSHSDAGASPADSRVGNDHQERPETSESGLPADSWHDDGVMVPQLPNDLSILPTLERYHLKAGAIILFQQFEVSSLTGWRPGLSKHKVAVVEEFDVATALVKARLIRHDWPERDDQGHRVYYGFEMPAQDGEDDDDDRIEVLLTDCIDARLLKASRSLVVDEEDTLSKDLSSRVALGSVTQASSRNERASSSLRAEPGPSTTKEGLEGSQATSVASANMITQDQAAQVRGSMLNNADPREGPSISLDTSGGLAPSSYNSVDR